MTEVSKTESDFVKVEALRPGTKGHNLVVKVSLFPVDLIDIGGLWLSTGCVHRCWRPSQLQAGEGVEGTKDQCRSA